MNKYFLLLYQNIRVFEKENKKHIEIPKNVQETTKNYKYKQKFPITFATANVIGNFFEFGLYIISSLLFLFCEYCFIIPTWRYKWDFIISTLHALFDYLWLNLYLARVFKFLFRGSTIIFMVVILEHNWHFLSGCDCVRWKISLIHDKCLQVHDFTENLRIREE